MKIIWRTQIGPKRNLIDEPSAPPRAVKKMVAAVQRN